jgi:sec-independent protein translocase protein TatC
MTTRDIDQQDAMAGLDYDEEDEEGATMTLVEHLEELRWRILKCLIAIVVGGVVAFIFRYWVFKILLYPLPSQANFIKPGTLVVTGLAEGFTVYLLVSLAVGIVIGLPVILYQTWAFISPGLYEHEKKYAVPFIFIGIILFAAGLSLGYIVLRFPVQWLISFASDSFTELVTASSYFTFVAFFELAFGVVFELPLVLTFLAQIGLVTSQTLTKKRPMAHVGMWIASTFLTPGADIYSPIILGISMSFLYELTIIFIKLIKK